MVHEHAADGSRHHSHGKNPASAARNGEHPKQEPTLKSKPKKEDQPQVQANEEDWQQNGAGSTKWNDRGAGHAVGGGEIEDSEDEDKDVHPIVKKIEKERRDARHAQELDHEQDDGPVELNDIEVDSGRPLGQMYQNYQDQEDSYDENAPNQNQHYP